MSDARKLVYAFIQFLKDQLDTGGLSGESAEGVEVGIQCLEAAYNISASEPSLEISRGILEIFRNFLAEMVSHLFWLVHIFIDFVVS